DSSTTYSAISGGTVVIRDAVAQQNLTGMTAAETIASLNRDTSSDTLNALNRSLTRYRLSRSTICKGWRRPR
ncbi:hypothetical protein, partial [Achromobacter xylosoxidans]